MEDTHIQEQKKIQAEPSENEEIRTENTAVLRLAIQTENIREELSFFKHLRSFLRDYGKNTDEIDFVIRNLEDQVTEFDAATPVLPDEERIVRAIEKHPYFKNPCDYPIRLITILKYLKRRGFNMNYTDIDLYVDKLLQKMEGVKKVGRGLYRK